MVEHFRMLDRQLLSGPLYRMLFAVASPLRVVHAADRRFRAMFEGITLAVHQEDDCRVGLSLRYAPGLLPPLVGSLYLVAFEVAAELAGAKAVKSRVISHGDIAAKYELTWDGADPS
jgi:hypothetical protein